MASQSRSISGYIILCNIYMGINIFFVFYVYEIDRERGNELCDFSHKDFL